MYEHVRMPAMASMYASLCVECVIPIQSCRARLARQQRVSMKRTHLQHVFYADRHDLDGQAVEIVYILNVCAFLCLVYACVYIDKHALKHAYIPACMDAYIHAHTYTCKHTHTHTCMNTYTYIRTYTHTHKQTRDNMSMYVDMSKQMHEK